MSRERCRVKKTVIWHLERGGEDRQDEEARKERIKANQKRVYHLRIENTAGGQKCYRGMYRNVCWKK